MKKRVLAVLLALMMVLPLLPTTALAASVTLAVGESRTIKSNEGKNHEWKIDNADIAGIQPKGSSCIVTGKRPGSTLIWLFYDISIPRPAIVNGRYTTEYDTVTQNMRWKVVVTESGSVDPKPSTPDVKPTPTTPTKPTTPTVPEPSDPDFTIDRNGVLTIYNGKYNGKSGAVTIPSTVKKIGQAAFLECTEITSVTIPNGLTSIGKQAFELCTAFTSITIPSSVTSIERWAFNECTSLKDVYYGGTEAQWKAITIGDSNAPLDSATIHYNSTGSSQTQQPTTPTVTASDFTIENGVLTKYNGKGGAVTIPSGVTSIGGRAFLKCTDLTSVMIPSGVTSIREGAFWGCTSLASVTIPNSVTSIEGAAFNGTPWLNQQGEFVIVNGILLSYQGKGGSVSIPGNVTVIGDSAFYDCTALTSVTIPGSTTSIEGYAFFGCKNLASVTIPSNVTSIGKYAFGNCVGLTSVTLPSSVTSIGTGVFSDCTGLTSITIPNSVTNIEKFAFSECKALKDVYYRGTQTQWRAVSIASNNDPLTSATIHSNGDGTSKTDTPTLPTVEPIPAAGTAYARTQTVKLDGEDKQFLCYAVKDANGNETNYVKLRDLAQALNGTKAQFNVGWDGKISIVPNTAYEVKGGEGTTPYSGDQPYKAVSDTPVSFNGKAVKLTSFQLKDSAGNGYTYYKLRDLGQLLNFNVKWDGSAKSVVIETGRPFTGQ